MGSGSGGGRRPGEGSGRRLGGAPSSDYIMEGPRGGGGSNAMEVDEPEGIRGKSRKCVHPVYIASYSMLTTFCSRSAQDPKAPRKRNRG